MLHPKRFVETITDAGLPFDAVGALRWVPTRYPLE